MISSINTKQVERIRTFSVLALALSAFVFNTTEFIPIALLSDIGTSFGMTADKTGMMMTVYAWIVALLSLPLMLLTAKVECKRLLLGLFAVFVVAHGMSVVATSFEWLLVSRALVALTHACFWSITAALVVRLAPKGRQTQALGYLATGSALATVLGLPLGRLLGQYLGWQMSFGAIGVLAGLTMSVLWVLLPKLPAKDVGSLASLPKIMRNKPLLSVYMMVMLAVTAHFTAYSYIEPFVLTQAGFGTVATTGVLLLFGVAGMVASVLFGRFYERSADGFLLLALIGLVLGLVLMMVASVSMVLWALLAFVWGVAMTAMALSLQIRVLKLAPSATDVAMSLFSGIFNIGIGGGALLGSVVVAQMDCLMWGMWGRRWRVWR